MTRKLSDEKLDSKFTELNVGNRKEFSLDCSFNKETTLNEDTKLVIVGTITPPNTKYFYCSYYNRIYGYIDEALELSGSEKSLKMLKLGLSEVNNERITIKLLDDAEIESRVDKIKSILKTNKIAFLDTMSRVIRRRNSPYDKDILYYSIDYANLKRLNKYKNVTVIANSKLASDLCEEAEINFTYLAQRGDTKETWLKKIREALKNEETSY